MVYQAGIHTLTFRVEPRVNDVSGRRIFLNLNQHTDAQIMPTKELIWKALHTSVAEHRFIGQNFGEPGVIADQHGFVRFPSRLTSEEFGVGFAGQAQCPLDDPSHAFLQYGRHNNWEWEARLLSEWWGSDPFRPNRDIRARLGFYDPQGMLEGVTGYTGTPTYEAAPHLTRAIQDNIATFLVAALPEPCKRGRSCIRRRYTTIRDHRKDCCRSGGNRCGKGRGL